jgi:multiple sugar transport system permease protein
LRNIPSSYYEAARIDGANGPKITWYITIPMLKPALIFVFIMTTIESFKIFIPAKVITDGGPGNSTSVLVLYIIKQGIKNMEMGYASAMSIVMLLIIGVITVLQWKVTNSEK